MELRAFALDHFQATVRHCKGPDTGHHARRIGTVSGNGEHEGNGENQLGYRQSIRHMPPLPEAFSGVDKRLDDSHLLSIAFGLDVLIVQIVILEVVPFDR